MERGAEPEPPPKRRSRSSQDGSDQIATAALILVNALMFSPDRRFERCGSPPAIPLPRAARRSAAAARALLSCAAFAGSRAKMSGNASAASILAMMPVMRSISASASAIFCRSGARFSLVARALVAARRRARCRRGRAAFVRMPSRRQHLAAIVVEIAVVGRDRAVRHHPQPVGAGVDQVAVVADHDHGAGKFVDRLGERGAAVDVEMVGRLVENDQLRAEERRKPEQQPRLLAARQASSPACRPPLPKSRSRRRGRAPSLPAHRASACGCGVGRAVLVSSSS